MNPQSGPPAARVLVFGQLLSSITTEMSLTLMRAAFSPNIKERRDFSCALFDRNGDLAAQAANIPVHLGSATVAVKTVVSRFTLGEGDVVIVNDPYNGGTHLPDITLIRALVLDGAPEFYLATRAHHADVGGDAPGSMPLARHIDEEGVRIPPSLLLRGGRRVEETWSRLLGAARAPGEREGDLGAQLAALNVGEQRLRELIRRKGLREVTEAAASLRAYARNHMEAALRQLSAGEYAFTDWMDSDGAGGVNLPIHVRLAIQDGRVHVDFTGSAAAAQGCVNAPFAVTLASVNYVFRCLLEEDVPDNAGVMDVIRVTAPPGSIVHAEYPSAVVAGNTETSQRIVDVLLGALAQAAPGRIPAASQGTMNNLAFGGVDTSGRAFAYYETIAGGCGAGPGKPGASGLHSHMTNTLNTPVEALERSLPVRVTRYQLRAGSGGAGAWPGRDGVIRELEFLAPVDAAFIGERQVRGPWGLAGGRDGAPGRITHIAGGEARVLPEKVLLRINAGERLCVETPGGGGFGVPE